MKKFLITGLGIVSWSVLSLFTAKESHAVAQWARKYQVNCQSCHTAFPRLNYWGEKFQRNGFQMPETQDGDDMKQKLGEATLIDNIINMFGIRVAVTPASVATRDRTEGGAKQTRVSFGNTSWVQFFSAGSIFKNTSIFIETEIQDTSIKNNWFTLGYHNIADESLLNLRAGKISTMNWHALSGRLRMIPNINIEGLSNVKSSEGTAGVTLEDQIAYAEPQPGIELYGYKRHWLYSIGVSNGKALSDSNGFKDFFGTLRFELTDGDFSGSHISVWGYMGTDTANTSTVQRKNRFYRTSVAANLRWEDWDIIGGYFYGRDREWNLGRNLDTDPRQKNDTHTLAAQVGYLMPPHWFAALQYDFVTDDFKNTLENLTNYYNKISPSLWYMPMENLRIGAVSRVELRDRSGGKQHEYILHVRSMF